MSLKNIPLLILISLIPVVSNASQLNIHNMTELSLSISINNGFYVRINSMGVNNQLKFVNHTNPGNGELGFGNNQISLYPTSLGIPNHPPIKFIVPERPITSGDANIVIINDGSGSAGQSSYMISHIFFSN